MLRESRLLECKDNLLAVIEVSVTADDVGEKYEAATGHLGSADDRPPFLPVERANDPINAVIVLGQSTNLRNAE